MRSLDFAKQIAARTVGVLQGIPGSMTPRYAIPRSTTPSINQNSFTNSDLFIDYSLRVSIASLTLQYALFQKSQIKARDIPPPIWYQIVGPFSDNKKLPIKISAVTTART